GQRRDPGGAHPGPPDRARDARPRPRTPARTRRRRPRPVRVEPLVKKLLGVALGILTAIGGFMDIGDIVANAATGARFGMSLAWAVLLGVGGIIVYAEMSGRVAAVAGRPTFDLVRERLGARMALANLAASFFINFLTLVDE